MRKCLCYALLGAIKNGYSEDIRYLKSIIFSQEGVISYFAEKYQGLFEIHSDGLKQFDDCIRNYNFESIDKYGLSEDDNGLVQLLALVIDNELK